MEQTELLIEIIAKQKDSLEKLRGVVEKLLKKTIQTNERFAEILECSNEISIDKETSKKLLTLILTNE